MSITPSFLHIAISKTSLNTGYLIAFFFIDLQTYCYVTTCPLGLVSSLIDMQMFFVVVLMVCLFELLCLSPCYSCGKCFCELSLLLLHFSCNFCPILHYQIQSYCCVTDIPSRCLCLTRVLLSTCQLSSQILLKRSKAISVLFASSLVLL